MTRKALLILFALAFSLAPQACDDDDTEGDLTTWFFIQERDNTIWFNAKFNYAVAQNGSWYLLANENGTQAPNAMFTTKITPQQIYDAMVGLGATPDNAIDYTNWTNPGIRASGPYVNVMLSWEGSNSMVLLIWDQNRQEYSELLWEDQSLPAPGGPFGIDLRFEGNYENPAGSNPADTEGCIIDLYTSPCALISSGSTNYNDTWLADGSVPRFKLSPWNNRAPRHGQTVTFRMYVSTN